MHLEDIKKDEEITSKNYPILFKILKEVCHFDTVHIPKHGKGFVELQAVIRGKKFLAEGVWDYTWGVNWDDVKWKQVDTFERKCPYCHQIIGGSSA